MRNAFLAFISTLLFMSSCAEVPTRHTPASAVPIIQESEIRLDDVPQLIADAHREVELHNWTASITIAKSVIRFLAKNGLVYSAITIDAYTILATAYYRKGEYESCIETCKKAFIVSLDQETQNEHGSYRAIRSLGDLYRLLGHLEYETELHDLAYKIALFQNGQDHVDVRIMRFLDDRAEFSTEVRANSADVHKSGSSRLKQESMKKLLRDISTELDICRAGSVKQDCEWNSHGMTMDRRRMNHTTHRLIIALSDSLLDGNVFSNERQELLEQIPIMEQLFQAHFKTVEWHRRSLFHMTVGDFYLHINDLNDAEKRFALAMGIVNNALDAAYRSRADYLSKKSTENLVNELKSSMEEKLSLISLLKNDVRNAERHMQAAIKLRLPEIEPELIEWGSILNLRNEMNTLAQIYWLNNKTSNAIGAWSDAIDITEESFRRLGIFETESVLLGKIDSLHKISETIINTINMEPNRLRYPLLAKLALASTLFSQARVADVMNERLQPPSPIAGQELEELFRQKGALRFKLAALESTPSHRQPPEVVIERRNLLQTVERLEAQLRRMTGTNRIKLPPSGGIVDAVAAELPKNAVLIDYVQFRRLDPRIPKRDQKDQVRYIALVLHPNGSTSAVDLGDAHEINRIVHRLHSELSQGRPDYEVTARAAYERLIGPLSPMLSDVQQLYLVPDADLHLLPFAVLSDGAKALAERFSVSYLSSGRDLLRSSSSAPSSDSVVVFANPDVRARLDSAGAVVPSSETESPMQDAVAEFEHTRSRALRRAPGRSAKHEVEGLVELPGAEGEAQAIADRIPFAVIHRRENATEKRLFELKPAPKVLHFATHGLFFGDQADSSVTVSQRSGPPVDPDDHMPNPLVRSALVLAGAAHGRMSRDSPFDGLLTALEISTGLALSGTKLVVLSACESARGVVLQGEGVASLQRAFLIAGAESVVASLWKVNDDVTKRLMTAFYTFLRAGNSRSVALRRAAAQVRSSPEYAHPYYWAGFVLVGQDGPIDGLK